MGSPHCQLNLKRTIVVTARGSEERRVQCGCSTCSSRPGRQVLLESGQRLWEVPVAVFASVAGRLGEVAQMCSQLKSRSSLRSPNLGGCTPHPFSVTTPHRLIAVDDGIVYIKPTLQYWQWLRTSLFINLSITSSC